VLVHSIQLCTISLDFNVHSTKIYINNYLFVYFARYDIYLEIKTWYYLERASLFLFVVLLILMLRVLISYLRVFQVIKKTQVEKQEIKIAEDHQKSSRIKFNNFF
jgi:hypothetical protein